MPSLAVIYVAIALVAVVAAQSSCNVSSRVDCGFTGITQDQCQAQGCCWNPVNPNPNNLPWCFYSSASPPPSGGQTCNANGNRADCGFVGITQQQCQAQSCCWSPLNPNPNNLPWCFYQNPTLYGYQVSNVVNTATGFQATLTLLPGNSSSTYGPDITPLLFTVELQTANRLHVMITDPNNARYQVPQSVIPRPKVTAAFNNPNYALTYTASPFGFAVTRKIDGMVLFNSSVTSPATFNGLTFKDQYLSLSTQLPNNANIYGLGEQTNSDGFRLDTNGHTYTLFNRDTPSATANQNLYGSHPFYLQMLPNGNAHGVLLMNSDGMDIILSPNTLTYKVIGGVFDFYFFMGTTPDQVVEQYMEVIGTPHMPVYWALGFHQSKYGYPNIQYVEQVVANYSAASIPLDTIWNDIDYMDQYLDFTFDPVNYPPSQVASFVQQLHQQGQQYVVILDPGIEINNSYASYTQLVSSGAYILDAKGQAFVGHVWPPGNVIFPDFLHPQSQPWWQNQIKAFFQIVPVDGLWIDMNEISNFCTGECTSKRSPADTPRLSGVTNPSNPPYAINNGGSRQPLNTKTLDMTATHFNGSLEYDVHNLYGLTESIATKTSLENLRPNVRSFVLTRSTFPSSGHHVAHWTGDNNSDFNNLYWSLIGMLNFNIFGVPFIGSDICGFLGTTTEELCSRWIEVGAFYPFSRNHNDIHSPPQELYRWPSVAAISRQVLGMRYSLLPYYYTLFFHSNQNGTAVIRPLFFQFPTDSATYGIDKQFLVGNALLISPVLTQGATTVQAYFPRAQWYDYYTGAKVSYSGVTTTLSAPVNYIPVHLRGGSIVPTQAPELTTAKTRLNPFILVAALDANSQARGDLFWDDGVSINSISSRAFAYAQFYATKNSFQSVVNVAGYSAAPKVNAVSIWGVPSKPSSAKFNNTPWNNYSFNTTTSVLTFSALQAPLTGSFTLSWQ